MALTPTEDFFAAYIFRYRENLNSEATVPSLAPSRSWELAEYRDPETVAKDELIEEGKQPGAGSHVAADHTTAEGAEGKGERKG